MSGKLVDMRARAEGDRVMIQVLIEGVSMAWSLRMAKQITTGRDE